MKIRIAGMVDDSVVDGDGIRLTIFTQGCPHHCAGCQNPETHAILGGYLAFTEDILAKALANPLLTGLTFSGGEPFLHAAPLAKLARAAHAHGLDIWCYTGFTLEELESRSKSNPTFAPLLKEIDVLVDGRFIESERDLTLTFRGSSNQRIIDMNEYRLTKKIKLLYNN